MSIAEGFLWYIVVLGWAVMLLSAARLIFKAGETFSKHFVDWYMKQKGN